MSVVEEKWQSTKPSLRERSKFIFNNDLFSDVKFTVRTTDGGSESMQFIPAHKLVLSISSPVFEAMFYGELAETREFIELPDCDYESLLELFSFMYCDEVNLSGSNVMGVLYLAKKYMVPSLADKCTEYLFKNLDPSNVFIILPFAQKCQEKALVDRCWRVIDDKMEQAAKSDGFVTIERNLLETVVIRDTLNIEEIDLFKAVDMWASKECERQGLEADGTTKRRILGEEIVKAIRFPVIDQKDFADVVLDSDILNLDEVKALVKYRSSVLCHPLRFSDKRRSSVPHVCGKTQRCFRFQSFISLSKDDVFEKIHIIEFSVDSKILLHGVCLCGGYSENLIELSLWNNKGTLNRVTGTFSVNLYEENSFPFYAYQILFPKNVVLKENTTYRMEARTSHPSSWCGEKILHQVTCSGVKFTFKSIVGKDFPALLFSKLP